jgi:hypothetical protein
VAQEKCVTAHLLAMLSGAKHPSLTRSLQTGLISNKRNDGFFAGARQALPALAVPKKSFGAQNGKEKMQVVRQANLALRLTLRDCFVRCSLLRMSVLLAKTERGAPQLQYLAKSEE